MLRVNHPRPSRPASGGRPLYTLFLFTFFTGLSPAICSEWSSSRSPAPREPPSVLADEAELLRDAPLYPPLRPHPDDQYDQYNQYEDFETNIEENSILVTPEDIIATRNSDENNDCNANASDGDDVNEPIEKNEDRTKRSSGQEEEHGSKTSSNRRVKTGDTILNIRGAVRDAIGDASASPGPRASSILDAFVIRPHPVLRLPLQDEPYAAPSTHVPNYDRELLVKAHTQARILCELNNVTSLRWYKDNEQINAASSASGGEALWQEGEVLVIARATRADAATWRCSGQDTAGKTISGKPTYLLIYEPVRSVYLSVDGRRLDAGNTWIPVREKAILEVRCVAEGGVPPPEMSWKLISPDGTLDPRPYLRTHYTNHSIEGMAWSHVEMTTARELHNASLICSADQRQPKQSQPAPAAADGALTAKLEIRVTYPPSFVISRWPGFGVALMAGATAALRCDVDANPPARAWWLRDDARTNSSPPPDNNAAEAPGTATLRWAELRPTHAGWYRCRATWHDTEYSSIGYYLNVMPPMEGVPPPTAQSVDEEPEHQKVEVPLGGNVQLTCPKGSVGCWWRRVVGNASASGWPPDAPQGGWAPAGSRHAHGVLGIKDAMYQEGGEYHCIGARAPDVDRIRELKRVTLKVTDL